MWAVTGRPTHLENIFGILRFRRQGVVSFRQFVVMSLGADRAAPDLLMESADTQPMRVFAE
jgi:hypothetical protein